MQLKLFQYKQVEVPIGEEQPRRECRSRNRKLLLCFLSFLISLCICFAVFGVMEYTTEWDTDEDNLDDDVNLGELLGAFERKGMQIPSNEECTEVRECLVDYYALFDIEAKKKLPPYINFFHKLQNNFDGLHEFAIDLICLAQEEIKTCINTDIEKSKCLSVKDFQLMFGLTKLDAREYAADLRVRNFECRNEEFLKNHFQCLYPTTQIRKEDLDECSADLRRAVSEHREMCGAMNEYVSCAREIFVAECGQKVSGFICNVIETAMAFNYPSCKSAFQTCH